MIYILFWETVIRVLVFLGSLLPGIETLPTIASFDIDTALQQAVGFTHSLFTTFWPEAVVFQGFLFLMIYYSIKITARFILGHRAPGGVH